MWYCPSCKKTNEIDPDDYESQLGHYCDDCGQDNCPDFRIRIISIKERALCDTTTEEAHKEGFSEEDLCARPVFLDNFMKLNWHKSPSNIGGLVSEGDENSFVFAAEEWNPKVFAIEFDYEVFE